MSLLLSLGATGGVFIAHGCSSFAPDTVFACDDTGRCQDGFTCIDGWCERASSDDGGTGDAGSTGGGDGGAGPTGGGDAAGGSGGGEEPADCVPGTEAAAGTGVFVAPGTSVDDPKGTPEAPCGDLACALERPDHAVIYLSAGRLVLPHLELGGESVHIEGGWAVEGGVWRKDCSLGGRAGFEFTDAVGLTVVGDGGTSVELRDMNISQSPMASPNNSPTGGNFAIWVKEAARLTLERVEVTSREGTDALQPLQGADGTTSCSPQSPPPSCGTGDRGRDGSRGRHAQGGFFTPTGYSRDKGATGGQGTAGAAGIAPVGSSCFTACGCDTSTSDKACAPADRDAMPPASCGIGGAPGEAGEGGAGGEASVALYVIRDPRMEAPRVTVIHSTLACKGGGAGAPGGLGGRGAQGCPGEDGAPTDCVTACDGSGGSSGCTCSVKTTEARRAVAGGAGGTGGTSGPGGSGAGGPCYGIVTLGVPKEAVVVTASTFDIGLGGVGGVDMADGGVGGAHGPRDERHEEP